MRYIDAFNHFYPEKFFTKISKRHPVPKMS